METATDNLIRHLVAYKAGQYPDDSMHTRLVRFYLRTLKDQWMIRDVHAQRVALRLNEVQIRILVKMLDQAAQGKPVRLCILKSRKTGVSTFTESLGVDLCAWEKNQKALTIAHAEEPTREIFDIARLAAECHSFVRPCEVTAQLRWPQQRSQYLAMTAGGTAVGAGGTPSFLHTSEGPKWEKNKATTFYNAVNSVPYVPETIVVHEFTAKGRELFFELYDAAGEPGHPYDRIFIAWYLDPTLVVPVDGKFQPDDDECHLRGRAHREGVELSNEQLQWRRNKIKEIGADLFRQEYPSTPEEAIQGAAGLIFPHMRDCLIGELPFDDARIAFDDRVGGIDFGYNDATVIWSGYYIDQVLYVTDYWRGVETLADRQVEALHEGHHYYCDPANTTERISLQRAAQATGKHCRFSPAPRRKNPGEEVARVELQLILKLMREDRLRILYKQAPQLIVECDSLAWNEKTGKPDDARTEACGHYDSIMALKYLVMGVASRGVRTAKERPSLALTRRQEFTRG